MCGLCGVFGGEAHWSDAPPDPAGPGGAAGRTTRLQARQQRVALANAVLRHYGLKLRDWSGSSYLLSGATGQTEIVDTLAALWPAAERLARRPCDPLDPALLAALEGP
jgi:hypothetical protein